MAELYDFPLGVSKHDPNFKKILQMIASFRGYETLESLKVADDQVRKMLARQLQTTLGEATVARKKLEGDMHLRILPDFDRMIERIRAVGGMFDDFNRSRIIACRRYRPELDLVGELYSLDFSILSATENVYNLMQEFQRMTEEDLMLVNIHKIDVSLDQIVDGMEKKAHIIGCMIE
ncbi:MAG: hypothetical protein A4E28_00866 [Methanocella sp. PtaU1.Bin125]|nr:MAG: hypothetical protein A4E28_00866 [Methanocella sp. PtaU1.Bin125]